MHSMTSFQSLNHAVATKSMLEDTAALQVKYLTPLYFYLYIFLINYTFLPNINIYKTIFFV